MYKIKDKYKNFISMYAWTKLDIGASYSLETWLKAGFKKNILEKC